MLFAFDDDDIYVIIENFLIEVVAFAKVVDVLFLLELLRKLLERLIYLLGENVD